LVDGGRNWVQVRQGEKREEREKDSDFCSHPINVITPISAYLNHENASFNLLFIKGDN